MNVCGGCGELFDPAHPGLHAIHGRRQPSPGAQTDAIPAQTITMSSDAFIAELDRWLRKSLEGFVVFRSAYYVRLRHLECTEVLLTKAYLPLFEMVQLAIEHDCPGSPE